MAPPPEPCVAPPPSAQPERDLAVTALLHDEARRASELFSLVAARTPQDLGAEILTVAAAALADDHNRQAALASNITTVDLTPLHAAIEALAPENGTPAATPTSLVKASEKKNLVVDDARWFTDNDLHMPLLEVDKAPEHVAAYFRQAALSAVFSHEDHAVARYGSSTLVASAPGRAPRAFLLHFADDESAQLEPEYAQLVDHTLIVQLAYNGYASATHGHNGYLAAYDASSGRLLWLSQPRVANASSFVVTRDAVITGYGFTAEPDFVYVLDLRTGVVRQRIPLKSAPSYVLLKASLLHVRTGGTDYVFRSQVQASDAATAALTPESTGSTVGSVQVASDEATTCMRSALAALDTRDATLLAHDLQSLQARGVDATLLLMLSHAWMLIEDDARGDAVIDLWRVKPTKLAEPAWRRMMPATRAPNAARPKLTQLHAESADPVRTLDVKPFSASEPYFLAPVENGVLPEGARRDIPSYYGRESLRAILPSGDRTLLVYGGRYLAVLRGSATEQVLDLDALRHPPKPNPQWAEFAVQDATFAQLRGQTLYVCNGGGSYARDVHGKKGFITAVDVSTAQILWRSDPLVCNSTFALSDDYLMTGYGFTDEPDFVYVLRAADGSMLAKAKVQTGPDTMTFRDGVLHVETYAHRYDFSLR